MEKARNERFADDPEEQVPNDFCCLTMLFSLLDFRLQSASDPAHVKR